MKVYRSWVIQNVHFFALDEINEHYKSGHNIVGQPVVSFIPRHLYWNRGFVQLDLCWILQYGQTTPPHNKLFGQFQA